MSHLNCIPKAQYWAMYNKIKNDEYYIESRNLRSENRILQDKILELEKRLESKLEPKLKQVITLPPLIMKHEKQETTTFSSGL